MRNLCCNCIDDGFLADEVREQGTLTVLSRGVPPSWTGFSGARSLWVTVRSRSSRPVCQSCAGPILSNWAARPM